MKSIYGALLGSAFAAALALPVAAQTAVPAAVPTVLLAPNGGSVLRVGTEVALKLREELTTNGKKLRVGQRFQMEVAEPVMVGDQVVIPVGSPVVGEITEVRNKGMWGKSGYLNGRVLYTQVNGRQIRLSGSLDDKGKTGTGGVVASIALVPLAGFFVTGTSALLPIGAPVRAFVDEDVAVAFAPSAGPAPIVVPASAPATPTS